MSARRPTIMHVIDSEGLYGAEQVVLALMGGLKSSGFPTILCSIGNGRVEVKPIEQRARERGFDVWAVRMADGLNVYGALRIARRAVRSGVDILHAHGYKADILLGLIPRALRRLPLVSTLHGWASTPQDPIKIRAYEILDGLALGFANRVVLVGSGMLEDRRLSQFARRKATVVPSGIERPSKAGGIDDRVAVFKRARFLVGTAGRLSTEKAHDVLVEALARLTARGVDAALVILGEGPKRRELESRIADLGLEDRVLMPGFMADARSQFAAFDVFALPSRTEGLPVTLLEAMEAGVPVVTTGVGGIPDAVENGALAALIPVDDVAALAEALEDVHRNPTRAARIAGAARARVLERFSVDRMVRDYVEIYASVLKTPRPSAVVTV